MRPLFATLALALTFSCSSSQEMNTQEADESASSTPNTVEAAETTKAVETTEAVETTKASEPSNSTAAAEGFYRMTAQTLEGEEMNLASLGGKVTLIVNVASQCGYTGQYEGLQALHAEFADRGFSVVGFPSNQFGGQEPGSAAEIRQFCSERYNVTFPMLAKGDVKGASQSPVYSFLEEQTGEVPGWNFCKYLIGKDGQVISFYKSNVAPDSDELRKAIEAAMG